MTELPDDLRFTDAALGTFVRDVMYFDNGNQLIDSNFVQKREIEGREVVVMLDTTDPAEARTMLPRVGQFVERFAELRDAAVEAIVRFFSSAPPTDADFADGARDLEPSTIFVEGDGDVTLHMTDLCGQHFLDGYWPAARFDTDDNVVEVTVEA